MHGAHLSSVTSGDCSANPVTYGVPGHSDLQQANISISSAQKCSRAEMLATPSGDYTRDQSRKTSSLCRLFCSMETTAKCGKWVLHTVERAYRIQFGSAPPQFNGVNPTLVGPKQALVMEREVDTLLKEKEAIEVVLPHEREFGFYSRYFIVSKNYGWRVESHFRSASVEPLTLKQVVSQIRSEDWIVTIDLKDAHFHVSILPIHTHSS